MSKLSSYTPFLTNWLGNHNMAFLLISAFLYIKPMQSSNDSIKLNQRFDLKDRK